MANVTPNLDQLFQTALQHHQAGRLAEAEQLYRQILSRQSHHADALNMLGVLAAQAGRNEIAVNLIRQAITLQPNFAEAHNNIGIPLINIGQPDEAIAAYRKAIALRPHFHESHYNLGNALHGKGQLDEAVAAYRQAVALNPSYAEAHSNLGLALLNIGRPDEAIDAFRRAISLRPNYAQALYGLGYALFSAGQFDEALAAYRQSIAFNPNYAEAHNNLGNTLLKIGQVDEGIAAYRQAIALSPSYAEAYNNLGNALKEKRQLHEAIAAYRRTIELKPNFSDAHYNLGNALLDLGRPDEAVAAYQQAIALRPSFPKAHSNLGNALKEMGQLEQAIVAYQQAMSLTSDDPDAHSNLLFTLNYHPDFDASAIAREGRLWNQQHAEPLRQFLQPHSNDRDPNRRLRIGYVSPDFREHCQSFFTFPLLSSHDHQQFEIFCYSDVPRPDALTARLQSYADQWRSIRGLTDEQLAAEIRRDRIDILVDLTMHMANNRMPLFARKPAPVQACWLAYPGTTGVCTIDYRLSDPYLDPPGMDESIYTERTYRLPHTFWCYDPLDGRDVPVNPLPASTNGFITFGCLNNFCKVGDGVLRLWARVLQAVPTARLLLGAPEGGTRQRTLELLGQEGVASERVEFAPRMPRQQYLELYHRIDLGLDTVPYNGHTTSLDSFWMGVPVVTLVGQTIVGRAGLCQLMNLKLPDLIAQTPEQYIQIAASLAQEQSRLAELRMTLRSCLQQSPLMDAPRFARNVEAGYRQMWSQWCAGQQ